MNVLTAIRKFFYLTPRDLGMQTMTVEEIADAMKPVDMDTEYARGNKRWTHADMLPVDFAKKVPSLLS